MLSRAVMFHQLGEDVLDVTVRLWSKRCLSPRKQTLLGEESFRISSRRIQIFLEVRRNSQLYIMISNIEL
jgi:hypothetical protein